jgi:hypothetical protein
MEVREEYYELYLDGDYKESYQTYDSALEELARCLDDDCAEIYKVRVLEERMI